MSARRKGNGNDGGEIPSLPVSQTAPKPTAIVQVGDIVLYAHRPMTRNPDAPAFLLMPMVVTHVIDQVLINGVVLADQDAMVGFHGAKSIVNAKRGDGPGEWRFRQ